MQTFLEIVRESLASINNPHFYNEERGFQGELVAEIRKRLPEIETEGVIVQQEYQKRMKDHGFKIRPDLIVHIPFEQADFVNRQEGNFFVIELKHNATKKEALADFLKLSRMCALLNYPLGIFINIDSSSTYLNEFKEKEKHKLHAFAVKNEDGIVEIIENAT
ncbi:hypothetical protein LQ318_16080 [Aliifodinibius salicampi]|uniref:Type I restriction enzyme R protein N terminus (HSDR_N) n=1 Tax=Fodinibius salicampi TaxID=1920655 RepID=A0ABT3Q2T1_9BACT|nr:hypothetical protein [Fodinibius salicampi]MCW9714425.1 hypothetical protein [Fodinibius salicampi]